MTSDYWVVVEYRTGKVIAHCGEETDARMLCELRPTERTYRKQRFIMDQVIDVSFSSQKHLPTSNISSPIDEKIMQEYLESMYPDIPENAGPVVLPEGESKPVIV